jgi:hypothetical protein
LQELAPNHLKLLWSKAMVVSVEEKSRQKGCKINHRALISGGWNHSNLNYAQELDCRLLHKPLNFEEILQRLDNCRKQIASNRKLSNLLTEKN